MSPMRNATMLRNTLVAATATLLAAGTLNAAPLNPQSVSAKAQWVMHVDLERVQSTEVGAKLLAGADQQAKSVTGFKAILDKYNFDFRRDVKGMTLYGLSVPKQKQAGVPADVAVLCHTAFNPAALLKDIKALPGYTEVKHGRYTIVPMPDVDAEGKMTLTTGKGYICFCKNLMVGGETPDIIKTSLDVLCGKAAGMKTGTPDAAWLGKSTDSAFYLAVGKLSDDTGTGPGTPAAAIGGGAQPQSLCFLLDEVAAANGQGGSVNGELVATMKTPEEAAQGQMMGQMVLGMASMTLQGEGRKPGITPELKKALLQLMSGITFSAQGGDLKISLNAPSATVILLVDEGLKALPGAMMSMAGHPGSSPAKADAASQTIPGT